MEHQEDASDCQNDEEETRDSAQTECVGESEAMAFDLCREDVEEEIVVDQERTLQIAIGYSGSEDGAPHFRLNDALQKALSHLRLLKVLRF